MVKNLFLLNCLYSLIASNIFFNSIATAQQTNIPEDQDESSIDDANGQKINVDTEPENLKRTLPLIHLQTGQYYPISGVTADKIQSSNADIVEFKSDATGIILKGKNPGNTIITIFNNEKRIDLPIQVNSNQTLPAKRITESMFINELKSFSNIKLKHFGNKIIIEGEILSRSQYQSFLKALKWESNKIIAMNTIAPGVKESLLEQARNALTSFSQNKVFIENAGNRFFLEGAVSNVIEVEKILSKIQPIIPNIENHIPIPIQIEDTVSIRIFMLELTKHAHEILGLSWPAVVNNAAVVSPKNSVFSPSWNVAIKHLATQGLAKILAEPMLSVKNGSTAEISAGGEIPLKIIGKYENKVMWKKYGLNIRIHVKGISGNYIKTKINTSSSQLDDATSIEGVPGIRSNHLNTEIDVEENHPILLTGIFQSNSAKDIEKIPVIGNIPIIGELFKSRRFANRESELLIAILPQFGQLHANLPLQSHRGLEFDKHWKIND